MTTVDAYAMPEAGQPFAKTTIERRALTDADVQIDIAFAGICHSDIHTGRNEWGEALFPLTPGHEIAGVVSAVGNGVTKWKIGDRVGVGCFVDSCRECEYCKRGDEQYCSNGMTGTYNAIDKYGKPTAGGYYKQIVVDENYVCGIPDNIELDVAAPLLCAGITLYSPLHHWNAGPGQRVGIIGLGGLGHMGVKIAHAMGAHVTAFSRSLKKEEDARAFGADEYIATDTPGALDALTKSFDLIINTIGAQMNVNQYFDLLKVDGTLVQVGMPEKSLAVNPFFLAGARRSYAGSMIGGIRETQEMLDFCGKHGIVPKIETIGADRIDDAWDRVVAGDVHYRFVIDTATI